jgi:polar amino acid transport system substrate-binding protein
MALREPNTMIYTIIRIPQREKLFKWVRPLGIGGTTSLYRLKSQESIAPKTIDEAKKYRVVANLDSMDHQWLAANGFSLLETPPKVENSVKMFFKGDRVDLIAFDDSVIEEEFKKFGFDPGDVVKVLPLFKTPPYMAVSLGTSDIVLTRLQKAYDELLKARKIKLVN